MVILLILTIFIILLFVYCCCRVASLYDSREDDLIDKTDDNRQEYE